MYKTLNSTGVIRLVDGAAIPFADGNRDYEDYKSWLSGGNTPEPADPIPNPRVDQIKQELAALDVKRIRPLAEGDADYLATLNAQTLTLRNELKELLP